MKDLGVIGRVVTFDDPEAERGRQVVWLQKLNSADHDQAVKKAEATRARTRRAFEDIDGDEYLALLDKLEDVLSEKDKCIALLIAEEQTKLTMSIESELELGENDGEPTEWGRDGYLQGLRREWADGIAQQYVDDEDDPDARRILNEFHRFREAVDAALEPQVADLRAQYAELDQPTLRDRAMEQFIKMACQQAWVSEFEKCEVWLATRKACGRCIDEANQAAAGEAFTPHSAFHDDYYFHEGRPAIDGLQESIREMLMDAYHELVTDVMEGKGSPGSPASSTSSESQTAPEEASGPEAAMV